MLRKNQQLLFFVWFSEPEFCGFISQPPVCLAFCARNTFPPVQLQFAPVSPPHSLYWQCGFPLPVWIWFNIFPSLWTQMRLDDLTWSESVCVFVSVCVNTRSPLCLWGLMASSGWLAGLNRLGLSFRVGVRVRLLSGLGMVKLLRVKGQGNPGRHEDWLLLKCG